MTDLPAGLKRRTAPVVLLALLLALGAAVVLSLLKSPAHITQLSDRDAAPAAEVQSGSNADASNGLPELVVHVTGAVGTPGVVTLHEGARVLDAIAAAGGLAADADPAGINLARAIADGEQLHVPKPGEAPSAAAVGGTAGAQAGPINLNTADSTALETLPRVGPTLAQRIIDWRSEHGPFRAVDELRDVTGIGEKIFADIAPLVQAP